MYRDGDFFFFFTWASTYLTIYRFIFYQFLYFCWGDSVQNEFNYFVCAMTPVKCGGSGHCGWRRKGKTMMVRGAQQHLRHSIDTRVNIIIGCRVTVVERYGASSLLSTSSCFGQVIVGGCLICRDVAQIPAAINRSNGGYVNDLQTVDDALFAVGDDARDGRWDCSKWR